MKRFGVLVLILFVVSCSESKKENSFKKPEDFNNKVTREAIKLDSLNNAEVTKKNFTEETIEYSLKAKKILTPEERRKVLTETQARNKAETAKLKESIKTIPKKPFTPKNEAYPSQEGRFVDDKKEIFISCRVVDKGSTKKEEYRGYGYGERVTIFQDVPDEERFPIFFEIQGDSVKIDSSIGGRSKKFNGTVQSQTDRLIKINAKRHVAETWKISIDRITGSIDIIPMGFLGLLDNYARASENKELRIYEGFCEDGSKRKF